MDVRQIATVGERLPKVVEPVEPELPEYVDDEDPEVRLGWSIRDRGSLEWALGRLGSIEGEKAQIEQAKREAIERIEKRAAALMDRAERGMRFFRMEVARYAEAHRTELLGGGKSKTANLLHGKIAWRQKGGRLVVTDKAALVAWLETQPIEDGLYRLKVEPEMKAIQEAFKTDNRIPPGCEYQLPEDTLHIEPELPEGALAKKGA